MKFLKLTVLIENDRLFEYLYQMKLVEQAHKKGDVFICEEYQTEVTQFFIKNGPETLPITCTDNTFSIGISNKKLTFENDFIITKIVDIPLMR